MLKKCSVIASVILVIFLLPTSSQLARTAGTVEPPENEVACVQQGGKWRLFRNLCAGKCSTGRICMQSLTTSCDCGSDRCWDWNLLQCLPCGEIFVSARNENEKEDEDFNFAVEIVGITTSDTCYPNANILGDWCPRMPEGEYYAEIRPEEGWVITTPQEVRVTVVQGETTDIYFGVAQAFPYPPYPPYPPPTISPPLELYLPFVTWEK